MPDSVFTYRMGAGIAGELSRFTTYGATLEPNMVNTAAATTGAALSPSSWAYGNGVIVDSSGVRPIVAGDSSYNANAFGFLARPFPTGDVGVAFPSGTVGFGPGAPKLSGVVDVLRRGYMTVKMGGAAAAAKGGAVYLYYGVSTGAHIQGAVEAAAGGNLVLITNAYFQGPADSSGITEIAFNL